MYAIVFIPPAEMPFVANMDNLLNSWDNQSWSLRGSNQSYYLFEQSTNVLMMATWQWQRMPAYDPSIITRSRFEHCVTPCHLSWPIMPLQTTSPFYWPWATKSDMFVYATTCPRYIKPWILFFVSATLTNVFAKLWLFRFIYTSCAVVKRNLVSKCRILVLSRHSLWIRVYYDSQTGKKKNCSVRNAQISWWPVLTGIMLVNFVVKSCTGCDSESLRLPHVGSESHTELSFFWKE